MGNTGIHRRSLLKAIAGAGAAGLAGCTTRALTPAASPFFERTNSPIGLQFGLIGKDARRDIDAAFAQVAHLGFREVEMSELYGRKPSEIALAAGKAGVNIVSLHLPLLTMGGPEALSMKSDPAKVADIMGELGATWAIAPIILIPSTFRFIPGESMETAISNAVLAAGEDIWKQTAEMLNSRASLLQQVGVGVAYHNHNFDFAPIGNTTGWDILWQETENGLVHFEVDVGWVQLAGVDPVTLLRKSSGRVPLVHVRDVSLDKPESSYKVSMDSPVVGTGKLDWARVLPAAYDAGARHFIVEQDPAKDVSRADVLGQSVQYLSNLRA